MSARTARNSGVRWPAASRDTSGGSIVGARAHAGPEHEHREQRRLARPRDDVAPALDRAVRRPGRGPAGDRPGRGPRTPPAARPGARQRRGGVAVGLDAAPVLEAAGAALDVVGLEAGAGREIGRRAGDQVEARPGPPVTAASRKSPSRTRTRSPTPFQRIDRRAMPALSGCASMPGRVAPRGKRHGRNSSTLPMPQPRSSRRAGRAIAQQRGRGVGGDQVVQREAVAVGALEDAPVAGQPAQILVRARPQVGRIFGRARGWAAGAPARAGGGRGG